MQCTPWHSFSQFDGRESTLPVINISSIGIELERTLNSRCAVIEVLQYMYMCILTLFSLSLIAVICRAIIGKTCRSEKVLDPFKSSYLPIDDDWRIVGDGAPDILFCGQ